MISRVLKEVSNLELLKLSHLLGRFLSPSFTGPCTSYSSSSDHNYNCPQILGQVITAKLKTIRGEHVVIMSRRHRIVVVDSQTTDK